MEPMAPLIRAAIEVALKATLLLSVITVILLLLRRQAAALRHRLAVLGLAGLIALPLLSLVMPGWEMPVLPEPRLAAAPGGRTEAFPPETILQTSDGIPIRPELSPLTPPGLDLVEGIAASPAGPNEPASNVAAPRPWGPVLAIWATGALVLIGRLLLGLRSVRRLAAAGVPLDRPDAADRLREAAWMIGCNRAVRLLVSGRISVPLTSGLFSPIVFLPTGALRWPAERLRIVLLHELAHVRRRDWAALLLRQAAEALYWFHPLAWWIAREARREAEKAADELVLATGLKPSVYAGHLLAIIRALPRSPRPVPGVSAGRSREFESRLGAILEPGTRRSVLLPLLLTRLGALLFFGLLGPLAAVRPWERAAAAPTPWTGSVAPSALQDDAVVVALGRGGEEERTACDKKSRSAPEPELWIPPCETSGAAGVAPSGPSNEVLQADAVLEAPLSENPDESDWFARGLDLHHAGRFREAIAAFQRSLALENRVAVSSYNTACGFARLGDREAAFEWLSRARREGMDLSLLLKEDEDLAGLRGDLRFAALRASEGPSKTRRIERRKAASAKKLEAAAGRGHHPGKSLLDAACAPAREDGPDAALEGPAVGSLPGFGDENETEQARERRRDAALRFEEISRQRPRLARAWFNLGYAELRAERPAESAEAFRRALDLGHRRSVPMYDLACAFARANQPDPAFEWLFQSLEAGYGSTENLAEDEDLETLRVDPRFREVLRIAAARTSLE